MSDLQKFVERLKAPFQDDWCKRCRVTMKKLDERLFAMAGVTVGHYVSHLEAGYYLRTLRRVERREDIPAGIYACRGTRYRCPKCGREMVRLSVFLPVRESEKLEEHIYYDRGQVDGLFGEK